MLFMANFLMKKLMKFSLMITVRYIKKQKRKRKIQVLILQYGYYALYSLLVLYLSAH